jgi:hypothetical protein
MNIVLVSLDVFQPYILINIGHLLKTQHKKIFILTNNKFLNMFDKYKNDITLIDIDLLNDEYNFSNNSSLDTTFRDGFWLNTSKRFFVIYSFMCKYIISDVIHIENDVLLYYNCDTLEPYFDKNKIYIPFDCFKRNICSIMYIPSSKIFKQVLDNYDFNVNDMYNFVNIQGKTNLIDNLPIGTTDLSSPELQFVTNNYKKFNVIFDAAAIGQYLGGVDPLNDKFKSIGFINETCIIKYNNFNIHWKYEEGIHKPFINDVPIFNLHIHSKQLEHFTNYECDLIDIVIPLGPNDIDVIKSTVSYAKQNIIGYRNIYIVCVDKNLVIDDCITIDERIFPFSINDVSSFHGKQSRNGWYLQQLLKLYSGMTIPNILQNYLVIDADTLFLNPTKFIKENNQFMFDNSLHYHDRYFKHMNLLHNSLFNEQFVSGVTHHMIFNTHLVSELFKIVELYHNKGPFWEIFLKLVDKSDYTGSGASEYEIYFNYMLIHHSDKISARKLKSQDVKSLDNINEFISNKYNYISYHNYLR